MKIQGIRKKAQCKGYIKEIQLIKTKSLCDKLRRINSNRQVDHIVLAIGGGDVGVSSSMSAEAALPQQRLLTERDDSSYGVMWPCDPNF